MDIVEKIMSVGSYMDYEPDAELTLGVPPVCSEAARVEAGFPRTEVNNRADDLPIFAAVLPGGRKVPLLKTMLTSVCERNCNYCFARAGRDIPRVTFSPDEMARAFEMFWKKGKVDGLFLSSGMAGGGVRTQDLLLDTAEILRNRLAYSGYLHLKIMPGAQKDQVFRAMQLADRVSINLEAPDARSLQVIAPMKNYGEDLIQSLRWVEEIRKNQPPEQYELKKWPSSVTQFVVGPGGETDLELLRTSEYLVKRLNLTRIYYSRFSPIPGTPFSSFPATNPWRNHRLYQAFYLLRDYGFDLLDIPFDCHSDLPLEVDPKMAWAEVNLKQFPLEVNRASPRELMRVPGFGKLAVHKIMQARRQGRVHSMEDLQKIGIQTRRAAPYILLDGKRPLHQLTIWQKPGLIA